MAAPVQFAPLQQAEKEYLLQMVWRRWRDAARRFLLTALLPMAGVVPLLYLLNYFIITQIENDKDIKDINIPPGIEDYVLVWTAVPIFGILCIVNLILILRSIPPLYIDISRGKKQRLVFTPQPYHVPGTARYFVNTGLPVLRFLPLSHQQYQQLDYSKPCYLELAPLSKVVLGFRTIGHDDNNTTSENNNLIANL